MPQTSLISRWAWPVICGLLLGAVILLLQSQRQSEQQQRPFSYAAAAAKAGPSVVNIYTSKRSINNHPLMNDPTFQRYFKQQGQQQERIERSLGSGVILNKQGYIVTNLHVIKNADEILVLLADGRDALAHVVGSDTESDLAVLRIDLPDLQPISIASSDKLRVGDVVLAIGNPYGLEQTVTQGIISALGRYGLQINTYENFIQTDAAINQGNSGGALIDAYGNLLGINTAVYSRSNEFSGIGLAIPSDTVMKVMQHIIKYGYVVRGWLGIEVGQTSAEYAQKFNLPYPSLLVTKTTANGPADLAGILPGDILLSIDNKTLQDGYTSVRDVADLMPGTEVEIEILRDGKALKTLTQVGIRPVLE